MQLASDQSLFYYSSNVKITGVQGLEYLESLVTPRKQEREERNAVDFKGEVGCPSKPAS
jgi:hypothetical protein